MQPVEMLSRRDALSRFGAGFGGLALGTLLSESSFATESQLLKPHFQPKAKAIIQLYMHGGPSHVDLLDPKPMLTKFDGTVPPDEVADDENRTKNLMGSPFAFRNCGESGLEFSEIQPFVSQHADEIAVVRSMFTEHRNHEQAIWMAQTGMTTAGRPTLGAWMAYGLGRRVMSESNSALHVLTMMGGFAAILIGAKGLSVIASYLLPAWDADEDEGWELFCLTFSIMAGFGILCGAELVLAFMLGPWVGTQISHRSAVTSAVQLSGSIGAWAR